MLCWMVRVGREARLTLCRELCWVQRPLPPAGYWETRYTQREGPGWEQAWIWCHDGEFKELAISSEVERLRATIWMSLEFPVLTREYTYFLSLQKLKEVKGKSCKSSILVLCRNKLVTRSAQYSYRLSYEVVSSPSLQVINKYWVNNVRNL